MARIVMRLWHYKMLPFLPYAQFKGELRELVLIMRSWRDKGDTNNILVNRLMDFPKEEYYDYYQKYVKTYCKRFKAVPSSLYQDEFVDFAFGGSKRALKNHVPVENLFEGWHNDEYLRICMAILYERHIARGKSHISDEDWDKLLAGYKELTGEDYVL